MNFLIIIPSHNEEFNIGYCLESLRRQTYRNFQAVVVNDGSTDRTQGIIEEFAKADPRFKSLELKTSIHQPGAKVVRTFYEGLKLQDLDEYDIICKFDADIVFPENYLEKIKILYESYPKLGMVSGIVKVKNSVFDKSRAFDFSNSDHQWIFENISSKEHVRGPIKSYRKECFHDIKGLRAVLGWDNIDVMLAQMHGWEVRTDPKVWVKHLRPTAYKYKSQKAQKLGEYFYNIGLSFPLAFISSLKSALKNRSLSELFITMKSFSKQESKRVLSDEEIKFIRKLRWQQMLRKFF